MSMINPSPVLARQLLPQATGVRTSPLSERRLSVRPDLLLRRTSEPPVDVGALLLDVADPALMRGHPAGTPARRTAGRLGSALWDVFPGHVALLNRDGVIVSVNRAWRQFGLERGGSVTTGLGVDYLEVCERAAEQDEPGAAEAAILVAAAVSGVDTGRSVVYP